MKASLNNPWYNFKSFFTDFMTDFNLNEAISEESAYLISACHEARHGPIDIENLLRKSVSNLIMQIVFGRRFEYSGTIWHFTF